MFLENTPLLRMQDDLQVIFPHWESAGTRNQWITFSNPTLTAKERLRRALEIMQTAYKLGYKVLHFHQNIDEAEKRAKEYQTKSSQSMFKMELVN